EPFQEMYDDISRWHIEIAEDAELAETTEDRQSHKGEIERALQQFQPVPFESEQKSEVNKRLEWTYDYPQSTIHMSKQTVSEIKRQRESLTNTDGSDTQYIRKFRTSL